MLSLKKQKQMQDYIDDLRALSKHHKDLSTKLSKMADDLSELWDETNQGPAFADGKRYGMDDLEQALIDLRKQQVVQASHDRFSKFSRRQMRGY